MKNENRSRTRKIVLRLLDSGGKKIDPILKKQCELKTSGRKTQNGFTVRVRLRTIDTFFAIRIGHQMYLVENNIKMGNL